MKKILFILMCFAATLQLAAQQGVTKNGQNTAGPSDDFVDRNGKTGNTPALTVNGQDLTLTAAIVTTTQPVPNTGKSMDSPTVDYNTRGGGNVISKGGSDVTARGVCYSTTPNPDVNPPSFVVKGDPFSGDGIDSFTVYMNLTPGTYYFRAYATNSTGTYYGNEVTYTYPPGK